MENKNNESPIQYAPEPETPGLQPVPPPSSTPSVAQAANTYTERNRKMPLIVGVISFLLLLGFGTAAFLMTRSSVNKQRQDQLTSVDTLLPAGSVESLNVDPAQTLAVNGTFRANGSFVLQPQDTPQNPVTGQFYVDEQSGVLNYYNGSEFVPIVGSAVDEAGNPVSGVSSINGIGGAITLGANLQLSGQTLEAVVPSQGVTSLQGQTGAVSLSGSQGIIVNGTQLGLSLVGQTGISINGNQIALNLNAGTGIAINGNTVTNTGVVSLIGAGSIVVTDNGNGTYTVADGGGAGGGVALAPAAAQIDNSTNNSIFINKTSLSGNLLRLQSSGVDQFVLNLSGDTTQAGDATVGGGTLSVGSASQMGELILQTGGGFAATIRPAALTQNTTYILPATAGSSVEICTTSGNCLGSGGGAASDSPFITVVNDPDLQGERALFAPINSNISITDFGPNGTVQIDLKTDITIDESLTVPTVNASLIQGSALTLSAQTSSLRLQTAGITRMSIDNEGAITLADLDCSGYVSGGALTTNASNQLICSNDDGGGAITGSAATNIIPKFTGPNQLGASSITDSGTTVSVGVAMNVQGGITASGNLTASGGVLALGNASQAGSAHFYNGTNAFYTTLRAGVSSSNITFTLPNTTGGAGECLTTNGSGALGFVACLGGVSSLNGLVDDVTIEGTANHVTVQQSGGTIAVGLPDEVSIVSSLGVGSYLSAGGVLAVNGPLDYLSVNGTLRVSNGTNYGSFSAASLTANRSYTLPDASGEVCLSSGNCIGGSTGAAPNSAEYLVAAASGGLTNERVLQSGTNINFTAIADGLMVNVNTNPLFGTVRLGSGSDITTLTTGAVGGAATVTIPNTVGANDTVCLLSLANCFGSGGGGGVTGSGSTNRIAKFDSAGNITNSSFTDTGSVVSLTDINLSIQGSGSFDVASSIAAGLNITAGATLTGETLVVNSSATFDTTTLVVNATTNRVGIGTASPSGAILDVQGNVSGVTARFSGRVQGADATGLSDFVTLGQVNSLSSGGFIHNGNTFGEDAVLGTNDDFGLLLETNGVNRLTVAANGMISSSQAINAGNVLTLTNNSLTGGVLSLSGSAGDQTNILNVQGGALSVAGNGRVGIGTNQPGSSNGQILDVQGDNGSGLTATFSGRVQGAAGVNTSDFVTMNQLSAVNGAFDNVFTRGGNAFGLETALGTNDAQDLIFLTNTLEVARFTTDKAFQLKGVASAPALSGAGSGRIYFDSTNGYFMCSENGSAYFDCFGTGSDTVNSINSLTGGLTLGGTVNQVSVADNGTNTITLSLPQDIATTSAPTFGGLSVTGNGSFTGTVSGASATGATHFVTKSQLDSAVSGISGGVSSLNTQTGALTIQGTSNQVSVNTAGSTLTLSLAQDIATTSNVSFAGGSFTNAVSGADAINANEFVTKGQMETALSSASSAWLSAGANPYVVDGTNVGIGTSSPQEQLHVATTGDAAKLRLDIEQMVRNSTGTIDMTIMGDITTVDTDYAKNIALKGNYAFMTAGTSDTLVAIDISDPFNPVQVGMVGGIDSAQDVKIYGDYAFVTAFNQDRLVSIDISDPTNLQIVGSYTSATYIDSPVGLALSEGGTHAYVRGTNRLTTVNITDPTNPTYAATIYNSATLGTSGGRVAVDGNLLYFTTGDAENFFIYDISTPGSPVSQRRIDSPAGTYSTDGALGVLADGNYAYVASLTDSVVSVFDVTDPTTAAGVGVVSVSSPADIAKIGDIIYVTSIANDTITSIDVSDPTSPTVVDTLTSTQLDGVMGIISRNNYLYAANTLGDSLAVLSNGLTTSFYTQSWTMGSARGAEGAFSLQSSSDLGIFDALTVLQTGNIGIGAAIPEYKLQVTTTDAIAASFSGRVKGVDAVSADEFVTKGQLDAVAAAAGSASQGVAGTIQYSDGAGNLQGDANVLWYDGANNAITTTNLLATDSATLSFTNPGSINLASTGNVGQYSDIKTGADGFARIVYIDTTNAQAKFIRCQDLDCTSKLETTLGSSSTAYEPSVEIGTDGLARIVYVTNTSHIRYMKCLDEGCTTSTTNTNATASFQDVAFDIGPTNIPQFLASSGGSEVYFTCATDACTSFTSQRNLYAFGGAVTGWKQDVVVDSNNIMKFIHLYIPQNSVGIGACTNSTCTSHAASATGTVASAFKKPSISIRSNSFPIATHISSTGLINTINCTDASCSSGARIVTSQTGSVTSQSSVVASSGLLKIAYQKATDNDLILRTCTDTNCSTFTEQTLITGGDTGINPALALTSQDQYRISYYNDTDDDLHYTYQGGYLAVGTSIGSSSNKFAELHVLSLGTALASVSQQLTVGVPSLQDASATAMFATNEATSKGIVVQGVSGQTADLLQAQDSTGAVLAKIDANGNLTVKSATVTGTLTVSGHIVSGNSSGSTTVAAGAAACTSPTVTIVGNDTAGTVTITTGTGCAATDVLATITFAQAYGATPRVTLTPGNAAASGLNYYRGATTNNFTVSTSTTPTDSTEYIFDYQIIQ